MFAVSNVCNGRTSGECRATPTVAGGGGVPGSILQIAATPETHTHTSRNISVTQREIQSSFTEKYNCNSKRNTTEIIEKLNLYGAHAGDSSQARAWHEKLIDWRSTRGKSHNGATPQNLDERNVFGKAIAHILFMYVWKESACDADQGIITIFS